MLVGIDESKRLGKLTALQVDRLVRGAVDVHRLTRIQGDPNTRGRVAARIAAVPHHDVDAAMAIARHVKGDDALAANRGEDGLVRPNRPKVLGEFIGISRAARDGEGEGAHRGKP